MKHYRFVIRNKRKVEVRYTWAETLQAAERLIWTRNDTNGDWEIISREEC